MVLVLRSGDKAGPRLQNPSECHLRKTLIVFLANGTTRRFHWIGFGPNIFRSVGGALVLVASDGFKAMLG